jgi:hypothetical protein
MIDESANQDENAEEIDGVHIDYLLFADWRDRIKSGLCLCTDEEHRVLDPKDELGVNVRCDRTQLSIEIMKDMAERWPWGIASDLAEVLVHLAKTQCFNGPDFEGMDHDAVAVMTLDQLAQMEATSGELNRGITWDRDDEADDDEDIDEAA